MKILFVFAHPDDETFSSGGTIAKLTKQGHTVKLICATKGEAGQLGDPPLTTQEKLGQVREKEQRCAAEVLGIEHIYYLGFLDGTLSTLPQNKVENKIAAIFTQDQPDIVVTFDKNGVSNHPDHIAISNAATLVFHLYANSVKKHVRLYYITTPQSYLKEYEIAGVAYSAFGKMRGTPDEQITTIVDISDTYDKKVQAYRCHQTQRKDWERFLKREAIVDVKKEFFCLAYENTFP